MQNPWKVILATDWVQLILNTETSRKYGILINLIVLCVAQKSQVDMGEFKSTTNNSFDSY